jgi:primosomal protein N' (replication factor Y)
LTQDQRAGWEELYKGIERTLTGDSVAPYLLHGVTGSGKTEVYLHAVEAILQAGKQAIVLVPEIALTPQTVRRFISRFPGQVGLVHSRLSDGERYDTWRRARAGKLGVVVGPRSALFIPFAKLGLIVLDESHDNSYYQSEPPFFHAREAAVAYARLCGAVCIFGSATPEVTSTYQAVQGNWQYLPLPARILAHRQHVQLQQEKLGIASRYRPLEEQAEFVELPPVEVVDMRAELKNGNRSIFSRALQAELAQVLHEKRQAILFLNRRGSATYVFCRDCGHVLKCPHCEISLTFHESTASLICHRCGYQRKMPKRCPACGGERIRQYGTGTEKVESEIQAHFSQARTLRWDYETTRKKGAHEAILDLFSRHRADVLVGTQMLAKGLDLPLVTLVGVVLADVGLNLPDYSAAERTFQVLTQVAGRAGRSPLGGKVILQTFEPEHYVIRTASQHSYRNFYRQELSYRRQLGYPPFTHLVRLEYRHTDQDRAEKVAYKLGSQILEWIRQEGYRATEMIGPVPCFYARLGGWYRWQIVLRGPDPASILRGRRIDDWRVEINPPSLL